MSGHLPADESSLSKKIQELVMILTARAMDCQYIWQRTERERVSRHQRGVRGCPADHKPLPPCPLTTDRGQLRAELFKTHKTSPATFQAALTQFGARGVTD